MGAALDEGKVIPKNDTSGTGFGRGLERLLELFPAWFNTWEWKDNHYTEYIPDSNQNKGQGQTGFHTFNGKYDYTKAQNTLFTNDCSTYPTGSCNPKANVYPSPPKIYSLKLKDANKPDSGYTWGKANAFTVNDSDSGPVPLSSGASTAILRFFAYADHDQMPIVRMAVDWGDSSDPYVMQGWFKNRKAYCQVEKLKYCNGDKNPDTNKPCQEDSDCGMVNVGGSPTQIICDSNVNTNRLYFGNSLSPSACGERFYQFTHIYECKGASDPKWNAAKSACVFTPKVQVLDNWGWCNSSDGKGRWNDNSKVVSDKNCDPDDILPWTNFSGTIEVKS